MINDGSTNLNEYKTELPLELLFISLARFQHVQLSLKKNILLSSTMEEYVLAEAVPRPGFLSPDPEMFLFFELQVSRVYGYFFPAAIPLLRIHPGQRLFARPSNSFPATADAVSGPKPGIQSPERQCPQR